jgi:hypothetical protein
VAEVDSSLNYEDARVRNILDETDGAHTVARPCSTNWIATSTSTLPSTRDPCVQSNVIIKFASYCLALPAALDTCNVSLTYLRIKLHSVEAGSACCTYDKLSSIDIVAVEVHGVVSS